MLAMLTSLICRLRDRILRLERKLTERELEPYWELLGRAERAVYEGWGRDALDDIERELRKMLGVGK